MSGDLDVVLATSLEDYPIFVGGAFEGTYRIVCGTMMSEGIASAHLEELDAAVRVCFYLFV